MNLSSTKIIIHINITELRNGCVLFPVQNFGLKIPIS